MKIMKIPCRDIRYKEFPDLLFGTPRKGAPSYFDATHFIQSRGDEKRHNLTGFREAFHLWIEELCREYEIDKEELFVCDEASGHLLIDECLALLFVVYIEPPFGIYLLERISEMLVDGFTVSDTWLARATGLRFTNEDLTQILEHNET